MPLNKETKPNQPKPHNIHFYYVMFHANNKILLSLNWKKMNVFIENWLRCIILYAIVYEGKYLVTENLLYPTSS